MDGAGLFPLDVFAGAKLPQDVLPVPLTIFAESGFSLDAFEVPHNTNHLSHRKLPATLIPQPVIIFALPIGTCQCVSENGQRI
jgi:hypothetical protein